MGMAYNHPAVHQEAWPAFAAEGARKVMLTRCIKNMQHGTGKYVDLLGRGRDKGHTCTSYHMYSVRQPETGLRRTSEGLEQAEGVREGVKGTSSCTASRHMAKQALNEQKACMRERTGLEHGSGILTDSVCLRDLAVLERVEIVFNVDRSLLDRPCAKEWIWLCRLEINWS